MYLILNALFFKKLDLDKSQRIMLRIGCLLVTLEIIFLAYLGIRNKAVDYTVTQVAESAGLSESQANAVLGSMEEADKKELTDILQRNFVDAAVLKNIITYLRNNDYSGMETYVKSIISEDDWDALLDIYYKYQPEIEAMYNILSSTNGQKLADTLEAYVDEGTPITTDVVLSLAAEYDLDITEEDAARIAAVYSAAED